MAWEDVAKVVSKAAPLVGSLFGPAGTAIGAGAGGLIAGVASLFGADPEDPEDLLLKMSTDPESHLKLVEFQNRHREKLEELAIERDKLDIQDRADARARERSVVTATGKKDYFLYVLAVAVVVAFGAICFILVYEPIPEGANQVVLLLFGGLVAGFTQVMNYFFGSSKGSADKTALMAVK
jgi:hypothetical protein